MTPKAQRRLQARLADQMRLERNGAPIPGEIAQFMTQPKPPPRLWQVLVERKGGGPIPVGPRSENVDALAALADTINRAVKTGVERDWTKAWLVELVAEPVLFN